MICEWLAHNRIHRSAEARNKNAKKYRLNLTRKISRLAANTHLINRLLLSSEPLITAQRKLPCKKLIYQNQCLIYLNSWQTLYFLFVLIYYFSLFGAFGCPQTGIGSLSFHHSYLDIRSKPMLKPNEVLN